MDAQEISEITRQVVLDADCESVWELLVDEQARADWLDDDRALDVVQTEYARAITWRWDAPDDRGVTSTVTITLEQTDDDRTVLTVTERGAAAADCSVAEASIDVGAWDRRLLGLELRCGIRADVFAGV